MSDSTEILREMRKLKKEKHARWREANTKAIAETNLIFEDKYSIYIFRESGKPKVDFFPGTGRWKEVKTGRIFSGGADSFLKWYKKRR